MEKRFIPGLIAGVVGYLALLLGGIYLLTLLLVLVYIGTKEYAAILTNKGFFPSARVIYFSSVMFLLVAFFERPDLTPLVFTICSILAFMWVLFRGKQPYIANVATVTLGFIYCGWFPSFFLYLRNSGVTTSGGIQHPQGAMFCILTLFAVMLTDCFCYFAGIKFGKHQLSKVISPKKTIEGAFGGGLMCLVVVLLMGIPIGLPWYHAVVLGLLIAVFAQVGDLCESMIKRDAGVKDSSDMIPGHGGLLDRTDSYVLSLPVVYFYLQLFVLDSNMNVVNFIKGILGC